MYVFPENEFDHKNVSKESCLSFQRHETDTSRSARTDGADAGELKRGNIDRLC